MQFMIKIYMESEKQHGKAGEEVSQRRDLYA